MLRAAGRRSTFIAFSRPGADRGHHPGRRPREDDDADEPEERGRRRDGRDGVLDLLAAVGGDGEQVDDRVHDVGAHLVVLQHHADDRDQHDGQRREREEHPVADGRRVLRAAVVEEAVAGHDQHAEHALGVRQGSAQVPAQARASGGGVHGGSVAARRAACTGQDSRRRPPNRLPWTRYAHCWPPTSTSWCARGPTAPCSPVPSSARARPWPASRSSSAIVTRGGIAGEGEWLALAVAGGVAAAALARLARQVWEWGRTELAVTEAQLVVVRGAVYRSLETVPLAAVDGLKVRQSRAGAPPRLRHDPALLWAAPQRPRLRAAPGAHPRRDREPDRPPARRGGPHDGQRRAPPRRRVATPGGRAARCGRSARPRRAAAGRAGRASASSSTRSAAARFSSRCAGLRVPGMGMTCGPWASVQASATCAGVASTRAATSRTRSTMRTFTACASGVKRA